MSDGYNPRIFIESGLASTGVLMSQQDYTLKRAIWRALVVRAQTAIEKGQHSQGRTLFRQALDYIEADDGPEDRSLAASLLPLADYCSTRKQYAEAERLYRRMLNIYSRILGPDHLEVAISLHNLAKLSEDQGKIADAADLRKQAAEILSTELKRQQVEPDHNARA